MSARTSQRGWGTALHHRIALFAAVAAAVAASAASVAVAAGLSLSRTAASQRTSLESSLSLAQLAGQKIIYSYAGLVPPASLIDQIRAGEAAGVIFFSDNIASASQLHAVVNELQAANASSPVHEPLLMMTDQEGGEVRRLPGAPTLSEKQIGEVSDPVTQARKAGTAAGMNLLAAGLNVNLAPVVDVYRHAGDFIDQYGRSYSSSSVLVAKLATAFITYQQATGVAATAKHFPGLGAATAAQDTDLGPVTLRLGLPQIRSFDELPYGAAISAGVKLVMVSWATYPALDRYAPAGMSPAVVQGELRGRLGFQGVTITDGLGAGALYAYGGFAHRAVSASRAGADLLLCSTPSSAGNSPANGVAALNGLVAGFEDGAVSRTTAEASVARIIALRTSP